MIHFLRGVGRFLVGLGIGGLLALGALTGALYLNRDKLLLWLTHQLSQTFSARIEVQAVQVGHLADLPWLSFRLSGFLMRSFSGDTLLTAREVTLYLNLWEALVEKNYRVERITLEGPRLYLAYDRQGRSPWQAVFREDTGANSPWRIEALHIQDGHFEYKDEQADFALSLEVATLTAAIAYERGKLTLEGSTQGQLKQIGTLKGTWLEGLPFRLEGQLEQDEPWLLSRGLRLMVTGLQARVEGGIRFQTGVPELSLRLQEVGIEVGFLRRFWPQAPQVLSSLQGSLQGQGHLRGPVGRGHLPNVEVSAVLDVREPFLWKAYRVQAVRAQGSLRWEPGRRPRGKLQIDSLFVVGGEGDTLQGALSYDWYRQQGTATLTGQLNLRALTEAGLLTTDTLTGTLRAHLQAHHKAPDWLLSGEGHLTSLTWKTLVVDKATFQVNPTTLYLKDVVLRHPQARLAAPQLWLSSYRRLWDTTAAPLSVQGLVQAAYLAYQPTDTGGGRLWPLHLDLEAHIDTLIWQNHLLGPLRTHLTWQADSFTLDRLRLANVAHGVVEGRFQGTPTHYAIEATFSHLSLEALHQKWPELDTLFPLLPHLKGTVSGQINGHFPLRQGRFSWAEAKAELALRFENFVVVESPYTYELFSLIPLTDFKRIQVGHVQTQLALSEGVIRLDTTSLHANRWQMRIAGRHTLRGELAYDLEVQVPRPLLDKSQARIQAWVEEVEGELLRLQIQVRGTAEKPLFRWKPSSRPAILPTPRPAPTKKRSPSRPPTELPVDQN